jgi:hypothetical protein
MYYFRQILDAIRTMRAQALADVRLSAPARAVWTDLRALPCSHVGGHEFAGNLLLYHTGGRVGEWFGLLRDTTVVEEIMRSFVAARCRALVDDRRVGNEHADNTGSDQASGADWASRLPDHLRRHWRNSAACESCK